MIDLAVRGWIERYTDPLGRMFGRLGLTPTWMTMLGLITVVAGAVMIVFDHMALGAGIAAFGSALDGLDGAVARATGTATRSGALVDAVSDRVGEIAVWVAVAYQVSDDPLLVGLCASVIGSSMLIPYLRAKADAEGVDARGGIMGRAERVILLTAGLVFGQVEIMLWTMAVLTWITVAQRFRKIWVRLET